MTRDDIITMVREAGFEQNSLGVTYTSGALPELLERFAALVAAAEREACATVVEQTKWSNWFQADCAAAIRARGETSSRGQA